MLRQAGRRAVGVAAVLVMVNAASGLLPASAASPQVIVNGQQMHFDVPPIERAERVLVPMRGVFNQLGASVAYQSGFIAATGKDGRTISMTIGSRTATINGNPTTLDVAPFTQYGRTFVPLRFISTALGATVNYNPTTQVATISNGATARVPAQKGSSSNKWILPAAGAAALIAILVASGRHGSGFSLNSQNPASGAVIASSRPTISANFNQQVNPYTVDIAVDNNDQTSVAYIAPNNFTFTPSYNLGPGSHTVRVTGNTQAGSGFDQSWTFSVNGYGYPGGGNGNYYGQNYINSVNPGDGSTVGGSFAISGATMANSRVTITISSTRFLGLGTPTANYSTNADSRGRFYQNVSVPNGIGDVRVQVMSTAPYSNASTGVRLTYHT